jgi:PKD domain
MKKVSPSKSGFIATRSVIGVLLCAAAISLAMFSFAGTPTKQARAKQEVLGRGPLVADSPAAPAPPQAATPAGGTLTSANVGANKALNYADTVGSATNDTFFAGMGTCAVPMSCSTYTLTIDPSVGTASTGYDPNNYDIFILLVWPHSAEDYDTWVCSGGGNCVQGNVIGSNASTADPETITLPTNTPPGQYTINAVMATGAFEPYTGTVYLKPKFGGQGNCASPANCTPPRYINYPAGTGQGNGAGEPSIGVDWNPNVATLKDTVSADFGTGVKRLNTGGVAFLVMNGDGTTKNGLLGEAAWRANFDDCPSPAINVWEDVSATFAQESAFIDPIGFVDHYISGPMGLTYPEPSTPGRFFQLELIGLQGNSQGGYSDNDGNSYLPGANGGAPSGPDHETLGAGPYSSGGPGGVIPPHPLYANAVYYCSQDVVGEAQCSRSDNGSQSFGPGVPIYNPTICTGGIHGHVKVARDGTVYVPNSSCGTSNLGLNGVAVSTDNGITWTENNVANSTGNQDPSVGIGLNDVGRPAGSASNTIYMGWISGDGHPHIADSHDRGVTWEHETDVGITFGVQFAVFPVVVAGDDNRAAFGYLGTGPALTTPGSSSPCNPYSGLDSNNNFNCQNVWHLYISTTYDGGANWITIDATPNDPVQVGGVCLGGLTCNSPPRNLLDFNDFNVDAEGRGMLGYADGCVNCDNGQNTQSGDAHATVARQSGGRRLFSAFDPAEPLPPASPQLISAVTQSSPSGVLVSWLEPDNGGSPITGYKVYRSGTSGTEAFLANVSGETNTKYFDPAPPSGNLFYYAQAINGVGEGTHCGEVSLNSVESPCAPPFVTKGGAGTPGNIPGGMDPTMGQLTLQRIAIGEPFVSCTDKSITFLMKVQNLNPTPPPNGIWKILFNATTTTGVSLQVFVEMDTTLTPTPFFNYGYHTAASGSTTQCFPPPVGGSCPVSGTFTPDGTILIKLDVSQPLTFFSSTNTTTTPDFIVNIPTGTNLTAISGETDVLVGGAGTGSLRSVTVDGGSGTYRTIGNVSCHKLPPVAVLSGTPLSGNAPLTVNFNGTASHPEAGACGTISSYTLDFGDGSAPVTNSTGMFSHSYSRGEFTAKLTVTDSLGVNSVNPAEVFITVESPLNLLGVVSRMQHGTITPFFDVNLPLTGTRGVECRSSSSLGAGNYQMVFQFDGPLTTVAGASVTTGTGSVSSRQVGLNNQEYIVNLTGVDNKQYIAVTLTGVAGAPNGGTVVSPQMGVLIGDVNASGRTDNGDAIVVRNLSGTVPSDNTTARADINASGRIDNGDAIVIRNNSGNALPTSP